MEQGMYGCWNSPSKVKYTSKNKVNFLHKLNLTFNLFNNFCNLKCFFTIIDIVFVCYMFASKFILFQKVLLFCETIVMCYIRQTIFWVSNHVLPPLTWHV